MGNIADSRGKVLTAQTRRRNLEGDASLHLDHSSTFMRCKLNVHRDGTIENVWSVNLTLRSVRDDKDPLS